MKNKNDRVLTPTLVTPPQEALAAEYLASKELRDGCASLETSREWQDAYRDHPVVKVARDNDEHVIPCA
eukprot:9294984-Pyramimonas_sp.AAC.1